MIEPFETVFAVPLSCQHCVDDVSQSVHRLSGVTKIEANLKDQLVAIEGTAPPSAIVSAIQDTGKDAILRGSGRSDGAAVCILETHSETVPDKVRGLARMVQVSQKITLVDLTIHGLPAGDYWATVRETGDISQGAASTGGIWEALKAAFRTPEEPRGVFGKIQVNKTGLGSAFLDRPVQIWELIGRSMVISKEKDGVFRKDDPNTLVGVIARSAGVWDNDKTVCSCSGKTVWEERKEQVGKGML